MSEVAISPAWNWLISGGLFVILGCIGHIYSKISEERKQTNTQINTMFRRMDEKSDKIDVGYVKKEVCATVHTQVKETLEDLKKKSECIPKIKAGIDLLLKKNGLNSPE